ncbi:protein folding regulator, putative [Entamoeba dispar SAW760]|uniref:Protein folding regulator, putative n=1 Tax=Entamoeba dispar (strain ATCC PRA-260 / SAW760) TaxID=370354 RepID=B0E9G0_ENTDS|nr:protein folding regulator, putative [Entamoeba dispar SAW760]EDR28833.1 protein folding regulator, putative [Entamoeba dispar SAW760]|eukprot:EDR28833.1 protein folding regulator, putative [Entamoeba dispar SAW760]
MSDSHDNQHDRKIWNESTSKKVEFENMNDGLLNFCLSYGFKGEDNRPKASKEDMEWLKKVMDSIESDAKLMYSILEKSDKYLTQKSKGEKTEISEEQLKVELNNLEELVESIDNANDFIKMNGQYELGKLLLEIKNEDILFTVWWVLQSIVQNNPIGQRAIYQNDVIMNVLKNQISTLPVGSKVLFKIICFICSFITENEQIQKMVSSSTFVEKYKQILSTGDEKIIDRLNYTLNKFKHKPF